MASFFTLLLILYPAVGVGPAAPERKANLWELTYIAFAIDAKAPELCAKIAPGANNAAGFNPPGYQTYFAQSRCYFEVATAMHDSSLCDRVRARNVVGWLDGSAYSRANCAAAASNPKGKTEYQFSPQANPELERILRELGYSERDIPAEIVRRNDPESMWGDFYESSAKSADFRGRLSRLPSFADGATAPSGKAALMEPPPRKCDAHFASTGRPQRAGGPAVSECCPDFDDNGRCDEQQPELRWVTTNDLKIEPVADNPPSLLCGNEPLRIAVRVRNANPDKTIPRGAGWLEVVNLNPQLFGIAPAALRAAIPRLAPLEEAIVSFPSLREVSERRFDPESLRRYSPRIALYGIEVVTVNVLKDPPWIDRRVELSAKDSPPCVAHADTRPTRRP